MFWLVVGSSVCMSYIRFYKIGRWYWRKIVLLSLSPYVYVFKFFVALLYVCVCVEVFFVVVLKFSKIFYRDFIFQLFLGWILDKNFQTHKNIQLWGLRIACVNKIKNYQFFSMLLSCWKWFKWKSFSPSIN